MRTSASLVPKTRINLQKKIVKECYIALSSWKWVLMGSHKNKRMEEWVKSQEERCVKTQKNLPSPTVCSRANLGIIIYSKTILYIAIESCNLIGESLDKHKVICYYFPMLNLGIIILWWILAFSFCPHRSLMHFQIKKKILKEARIVCMAKLTLNRFYNIMIHLHKSQKFCM